jgi:hypothetical protein
MQLLMQVLADCPGGVNETDNSPQQKQQQQQAGRATTLLQQCAEQPKMAAADDGGAAALPPAAAAAAAAARSVSPLASPPSPASAATAVEPLEKHPAGPAALQLLPTPSAAGLSEGDAQRPAKRPRTAAGDAAVDDYDCHTTGDLSQCSQLQATAADMAKTPAEESPLDEDDLAVPAPQLLALFTVLQSAAANILHEHQPGAGSINC